MVSPNGLLRIFWPSDLPRDKTQGVIVGWRNSELDVFVVSIIQGVEVEIPVEDPCALLLTAD